MGIACQFVHHQDQLLELKQVYTLISFLSHLFAAGFLFRSMAYRTDGAAVAPIMTTWLRDM